ncbi:hypothetical protein EDB86DRAFT_10003 [Lactarius hatsudake]|nr:hypothetical protein EDB86DRAFT_10003 [Lactarius hatsudake]
MACFFISPRKDLPNNSHIFLYVAVVIAPADRPLPAAKNFEIIQALQTQIVPELFARPGVYDGRKNLFTAYELPIGPGGRSVGPSSHCSLVLFICFPSQVCGASKYGGVHSSPDSRRINQPRV